MANMAVALITHGRIRTTLAKAKALRPYVEKIITLAKNALEASPERAIYLRRLARARLRDKVATQLLFNEKASEFKGRPGGYTRIYKLGEQRRGDAAEMALIELIPGADEGYAKRKKPKASKAKAAAATEAPATSEVPAASPGDAPVPPEQDVSTQGEKPGEGDKPVDHAGQPQSASEAATEEEDIRKDKGQH